MREPIQKFFKIHARGSSFSNEIFGGLTTFAATAYILAAHPSILSQTGMDKAALVTATALVTGLVTIAVGLLTNVPLAMAPGMGLNAYFAFTLCGAAGMPWRAALAVVFTSGILFFLISMTPLRQQILRAFPTSLRSGISAGIGAFLLFLGLKNAGIIVSDPVTFVAGHRDISSSLGVVLVSLLFGVWLVSRRVPGSLLLVMSSVTFMGLFLPGPDAGSHMTSLPEVVISVPHSLGPILFQFDWAYCLSHPGVYLSAVMTFLLVDLFDTTGTLMAVGQRSGAMNAQGDWPEAAPLMRIDAAATALGASLGTSPVTSYIESCAGIEAGAKTGLASIITGLCFLISLWMSPLILSIPPEATAIVLIVVGVLMLQSLRNVPSHDLAEFFPPIFCVFLIPMTFSISHGIALGFLSFLGLSILNGRRRELLPSQWALGLIFIVVLLVGL